MNFKESINICIKKYTKTEGRASRSEFWYFCLFCLLVGIVTLYIDISVLGYSVEEEYTPLNTIAYLAVFIPSISVTARRLHDIGKSGWWMLLALTGIGIILLIIWYATEGEKKKNRFGNPIKIK